MERKRLKDRVIRQTHELEKAAHFIGNVEGKDLFGNAILLSDGFVGNGLKVSVAPLGNAGVFKRHILGSALENWAALLMPSLKRFKRHRLCRYGGAPLLGVNGVVIIGHGRSS